MAGRLISGVAVVILYLCYHTEGRNYHIAILPTTDTPREAYLNYKLEPGRTLPDIYTPVTTCMPVFSTVPSQVSLGYTTCDELFTAGIGVSNVGVKIDLVDSLHVYTETAGLKQDAYMAIPDQHLGTEYYVITYCSTGGYCQFAIVATENETNVNIVFPNNVTITNECLNNFVLKKEAPEGQLVSITLNESSVFYYESLQDLSGTYINSDKVVSVFVGARDVPDVSGTRSLVEQIPPTSKWGSHFIVAPFHLNPFGDVIKIISLSVGTEVYIPGYTPFIIDKAGHSTERRVDWAMYGAIETSKPVLILQIFSVDLYNCSADIFGHPAMSILLHSQQLSNQDVEIRCDNPERYSVLTYTEHRSGLTPFGSGIVSAYIVHSEVLDGGKYGDYGIMVLQQTGITLSIHNPQLYKGGYSYCEATMAMPVNADWTWENEVDVCLETAAYPGDGIDNDCDGKVDDIQCNLSDMRTLLSVADSYVFGGVTNNWTIIRGASELTLQLTSCANVVFKLQNDEYPAFSLTIQINPSTITMFCVPNCNTTATSQTSYNCSEQHMFKLQWDRSGDDLIHRIIGYVTDDYLIPNTSFESYDKLLMTAFGDEAQVYIDISQHDCKPITRGDDLFGKGFMIPVQQAVYYDIIITAIFADAEISAINIASFTVFNGTSHVIRQSDFISSPSPQQIFIKSDVDVAVYFTTNLDNEFKGMHIYPFDAVSNVYQLKASTTPDHCLAYAINRVAATNIGTIYTFKNNMIAANEYNSLGYRRLLKSDTPLAVFCRTTAGSLTQLNPTETFGRQFHIPPIQLSAIDGQGKVNVIASEDSTVVVHKELYDQLVMLEWTGDVYEREFIETDTVISIVSSKPVQVLLQLKRSSANTDGRSPWVSDIYIPSVEQYTSTHYFPAFGLAGYSQLLHTIAVDENGKLDTNNGINSDFSIVQEKNFPLPSFSITCLETSYSQVVVIASHHYLKTINGECTLTKDEAGDGVDADCDGLVDEEDCSVYTWDNTSNPLIDTDLDGNIDRDCAVDTTAPPTTTYDDIDTSPCFNIPIPVVVNVSNQTISLDINTTQPISQDIVTLPTISVVSSAQAWLTEPVQVAGLAIPIPDLNEYTANLTAETCVTECMCPCGWVLPVVNYTAEEIQHLVLRIQSHLSVHKPSLSVTIRQKTSAEDDRPSALAVGYLALVALLMIICCVGLLDISNLVRDIRSLLKRLRVVMTKGEAALKESD